MNTLADRQTDVTQDIHSDLISNKILARFIDMRKILMTALVLGASSALQAQDTYLNERLVNSAGEINGTARYVGMGGAMGALGADLSCMSYNPAGIGLYRRNDIGFTAGAQWNTQKVDGLKNARGTFDQIGFVWSSRLDNDKMPFLNFGFNYQKKINFGQGFIADNPNLAGLSQMDQLADLATGRFDTDNNLAGAAVDYDFLTPFDANGNITSDKDNIDSYLNKYNGEKAFYTHDQWGGLNAFDINVSGNANDRFYWGLTLGFENLKYHAYTDYFEMSSIVEDGIEKHGDYSLSNDRQIDGWGFNMKFGFIVRPIEDKPLRLGLTMETPTWYQLRSSTLYQLYDEILGVGYSSSNNTLDESYLEYSLHNPIKGRLSIGSTVGSYLAWDVDWEFANYGKTSMGYPNGYNYDGSASLFNNKSDAAMNQKTHETLGFQHTVKAGIEVKPTKSLALRLGYSFNKSPYKDNINFDQYAIDSYAMEFATSTSYMKVGNSNTLTLGLGYKYKNFYADMAYKVCGQKADFYHFDDTFNLENHTVVDTSGQPVRLAPTEVNLGRQQLTATLGFKF